MWNLVLMIWASSAGAEKTFNLCISYCKHVGKETPGSIDTFFLYKQLVQQEKMCSQILGSNSQTSTGFIGSLFTLSLNQIAKFTGGVSAEGPWSFLPLCWKSQGSLRSFTQMSLCWKSQARLRSFTQMPRAWESGPTTKLHPVNPSVNKVALWVLGETWEFHYTL